MAWDPKNIACGENSTEVTHPDAIRCSEKKNTTSGDLMGFYSDSMGY